MILFFDIDGVLADFTSAALHHHQVENPWLKPENLGTYDIVNLCNLEASSFWGAISNHEFWANLEPLQDGMLLLRRAMTIPNIDIYLLTSPILSPYCSSGKQAWVDKHLPSYSRKLFIAAAKHVFASIPDVCLLDDCDVNVDKFRKAGGRAILWPQPWNSAHAHQHDRITYAINQIYGNPIY